MNNTSVWILQGFKGQASSVYNRDQVNSIISFIVYYNTMFRSYIILLLVLWLTSFLNGFPGDQTNQQLSYGRQENESIDQAGDILDNRHQQYDEINDYLNGQDNHIQEQDSSYNSSNDDNSPLISLLDEQSSRDQTSDYPFRQTDSQDEVFEEQQPIRQRKQHPSTLKIPEEGQLDIPQLRTNQNYNGISLPYFKADEDQSDVDDMAFISSDSYDSSEQKSYDSEEFRRQIEDDKSSDRQKQQTDEKEHKQKQKEQIINFLKNIMMMNS